MIEIRCLQRPDLSALDTLFSSYRFGRYCSPFSGLPLDQSRSYVAQSTRAYCSAAQNMCWVAEAKGQIQGLLGMRRSQWDTEILGREVAVLDHLICSVADYEQELAIKTRLLKKGLQWCIDARIAFLSARPDALDLSTIQVLQQHSFLYIETTVSNSYVFRRKATLPHSRFTVRPIRRHELDQVADMTKHAFLMHRFAADHRFSIAEIEKLYYRWVVDRYEKDGRHIAVMDVDGTCAGFVLYSLADLTIALGLKFALWEMAVLSDPFRGRGLGYELFLAMMNDLADKVDVIDSGVTLRNIPSFTLHEKLGFRVNSSGITLHKWMDQNGHSGA